jgi:type 1 fimbriae regulatory protein FimB/type 1 fimbriae regulatory protein FimE
MSLMSTSKDAVRKPRRKKKVTRRSRDYVLPKEMDRVLKAAINTGRYGHRNYTLILLCYRHGLRVGEVAKLRWRMVDFKEKVLRVTRLNNGINSVQPLRREELVALRKLKRDYPGSSYLFRADRGTKVTESVVRRIVAKAGREANLGFHLHPRMLRHGCGHALADAGHNMLAIQNYLGHRNIRHTLRYMELPPKPFKHFWRD